MNVLYHPGKANVVVDSLSHMTIGSVPHMEEDKKDLAFLSRLHEVLGVIN